MCFNGYVYAYADNIKIRENYAHRIHFFNVFWVFHFSFRVYSWKEAKIHPCASAIKNCNVNFILCYPHHKCMLLFYTHTTHILTPTTLMVAENFIYVCRKTEKFSVCCCCCCRYRSWCYSIQSHHHQMHFIFIIYACTETVSLYMHLECTLPMKCK